jgi:hypothetical protein
MRKLLLIAACYMLLSTPIVAQQTITITTGPRWKDAVVYKDLRSGYTNRADYNYGDYPRLSATAWTNSGSATNWRSLLYFNLDIIPTGSTIHSATLFLYSDPTVTSASSNVGNSQSSGSNAFYLERIIDNTTVNNQTNPGQPGEWYETTVTWNNQPPTTTSGRIWVGPSTSATENRQITMTPMVQGWVNNPGSNMGIKMILENELYYRARNYASTNHPNANLHPKLVVSFTPPTTVVDEHNCGTPDPSEAEYVSLPWYGNETYLSNYYDSLSQKKQQPTIRQLGDIEFPWLRIPIKLWVYRNSPTDPGGISPITDEEGYQRMMDNLNNAFRNNGINLRFYLNSIGLIDKPSAVRVIGYDERIDLANQYRDPNAVNIHIADELDANMYHPIYNAIFIRREIAFSQVNASTFTHEVGHFFGLMHTHMFDGILCFREPVTRGEFLTYCPNRISIYSRRCNFTGDLLCDTQADPDMSEDGRYLSGSCTWDPQGKTDFRGDLYRPHFENYMAYGNRGNFTSDQTCRSYFSPGQRSVMMRTAFKRQYRSNWEPVNNNRFDRFEPDDTFIAAREIMPGSHQEHTFHVSGRSDLEDWLEFTHPGSGSLGNYHLVVTQVSTGAVGVVNVFLRNLNGTIGNRLTGITAVTNGNTTTYTIPCSSLARNRRYLVQINRGTGSGTMDYEVELLEQFPSALYTISGAVSVCSGNYTYTIGQTLPPQTTISWGIPAGFTEESRTTTGITLSTTGSGTGTVNLSAQLNRTCGSSTQLILPITFAGSSGEITGTVNGNSLNSSPNFVPGYSKIYVNYPGATSFSWTLTNGNPSSYYIYRNGAEVDLYLNSSQNSASFQVSTTTTCGSTIIRNLVFVLGPTSGLMYTVYPNPASTEFIIELASEDTHVSSDDFEYYLYDSQATLKKSEKIKSGKKSKIDVRGLRAGLYELIIKTPNKYEQHHIKID